MKTHLVSLTAAPQALRGLLAIDRAVVVVAPAADHERLLTQTFVGVRAQLQALVMKGGRLVPVTEHRGDGLVVQWIDHVSARAGEAYAFVRNAMDCNRADGDRVILFADSDDLRHQPAHVSDVKRLAALVVA